MKESEVENYLVRKVVEHGGEIRKLKWINRRGAPDRVVFLRGVHFVELKRPGGKLRPEQEREHQRMIKHGAHVYTIDSKELIDELIKGILK